MSETLPSKDEALRQWGAELACSRFHDYAMELALDRARRFSKVDRAVRDSQGNLIIFGESYIYQSKAADQGPQKVDVVGLDLRAPNGWVMAWMVDSGRYDAVQSDRLTSCKED